MADHSLPTTATSYLNVLSNIDGRIDDALLGLDPATTSPANVPTNSIRWTSASAKWQKWNGSTWGDLASAYSININGTVGGTTPAQGNFTVVGIGKASPADAVDIEGATAPTSRISVLRTGSTGCQAQVGSQGNAAFLAATGSHPLIFYTNGNDVGRLDSGGSFMLGMSSALDLTTGSTDGMSFSRSTNVLAVSRDGGLPFALRRRNSDGSIAQFYRGTTAVGSISVTTTATAYNTSSDYRLKAEITDIDPTEAGAFIDALRPRKGKWKADGSLFLGFIAHEFAEVCPQAVTGIKDGPEMQSMQASHSAVMANIIAELQALRARVAALEAVAS